VAEAARWVWLGGSLLLAVLLVQVSWWLSRRWQGQARFDRFVDSALFPSLLQVGRLLYYIGLPFAALIWGRDAVVERLLGLQPLDGNWADWAGDASWAVALGLAAWAVLAVGWWAVRRAGGGPRPTGADASAWTFLREAAFHEVHWAFYRNAPVVALGMAWDVDLGTYWGTWAGLALAALEAALDPRWRANLRDAERAPATLVRAALAVLSAVFYLQTTNIWLAVLVHWGVTWGLAAWTRVLPLRDRQARAASADLQDLS
jgi:hypothetical protein